MWIVGGSGRAFLMAVRKSGDSLGWRSRPGWCTGFKRLSRACLREISRTASYSCSQAISVPKSPGGTAPTRKHVFRSQTKSIRDRGRVVKRIAVKNRHRNDEVATRQRLKTSPLPPTRELVWVVVDHEERLRRSAPRTAVSPIRQVAIALVVSAGAGVVVFSVLDNWVLPPSSDGST